MFGFNLGGILPFGAFRPTAPRLGGLLWKIPATLSRHQKRRQRRRLRAVDGVVDVLSVALKKKGERLEKLERWRRDMPREEEMMPRDKYSMFDRKVPRTFRKGVHRLPKWTRMSQRVNPPGY